MSWFRGSIPEKFLSYCLFSLSDWPFTKAMILRVSQWVRNSHASSMCKTMQNVLIYTIGVHLHSLWPLFQNRTPERIHITVWEDWFKNDTWSTWEEGNQQLPEYPAKMSWKWLQPPMEWRKMKWLWRNLTMIADVLETWKPCIDMAAAESSRNQLTEAKMILHARSRAKPDGEGRLQRLPSSGEQGLWV